MNITLPRVARIAAIAAVCGIGLTSCGGGGGGGDSAAPVATKARSVSGTAAVGRPLSGATVTLKGANGRTARATTAADGSFLFPDVSLFTWPMAAQVEGGEVGCIEDPNCRAIVNAFIYTAVSIIAAGDSDDTTINLTPLADAIVAAASGNTANDVFLRPELLNALTSDQLLNAQVNVLGWLLKLDPAAVVPANTNPLSTPFKTRPTDAHDQLLDALDNTLTALKLTPQQFTVLTRSSASSTGTPAVPIYCDVAGSYSGNYAGNDQGNWSASIDAYTGRITASGRSTLFGSLTFSGEGTLTRTGIGAQRTSGGIGFAGLSVFSGSISDTAVFSGNWTNPLQRGSFSGQRTNVAAGCN